MKRVIFAGLLSLSTVAQAGSPPGLLTSPAYTDAKIASLRANLVVTGLTIPANFMGFSINPTTVTAGAVTPSSTSLLGLVELMGTSGRIRIGANDSDLPTPIPLNSTITNNFCNFVAALGSGWTSLWTLDAVANDSATAATQAGLLATSCGVTKITFQFGNEPTSNGFTPTSYKTMWNSYYAAVHAAVPTAQYAAWDDNDYIDTQSVVAGLTPGLSGMTAVTQHFYNVGGVPNIPCTVPITSAQLISTVKNFTANSTISNMLGFAYNIPWAGSIPMVMSETNGVCSARGAVGTGDRLVETTYLLNEAITLAQIGWAGICVHSNPYQYNPTAPFIGPTGENLYGPLLINSDLNWYPNTGFYGMYLFSKIEGQQIVPLAVGGNANVIAIATKGGGGNANIIVVNNDVFEPTSVIPDQSSAWTTATVLQIKGAGCSDAGPLTIGGQSIGVSGVWTGAPFTISKGASVSLGPCESALISIQP